MNPLLEDRLPDYLRGITERSPAMSVELLAIDRRVHQRRRRRSGGRAAGGVGLAVIAGAAVFAIGAQRTPDPSKLQPGAEVQAPIAESPLSISPTAMLNSAAVKPGALAVELADGQQLTFGVIGWPYFDGYKQLSCVAMDSEATCRVQPSDAEVSITPESELGGNDNVVYWTQVPESTDMVRLFAGGTISWQHPIGGVAAFPVATHSPDDTLVAFDAAGTELARVSWSQTHLDGESSSTGENGTSTSRLYTSLDPPLSPGVDISLVENLTQSEEDAYRSFAQDTMLACLARGDSVGWTACIQSTDAAVKSYLQSLPDAGTETPHPLDE